MKKVPWVLAILACVLLSALPTWSQTQPAAGARPSASPLPPKASPDSKSKAGTPTGGSSSTTPPPGRTTGAAPKAPPAAGSEAPADGAEFQIRLRELEQRVEELKEQIRQSHARLSLLSDTILAGGQGGGRVNIRFENELSAAWHIIEITVVFDGAVQYKKSDESGALSAQKSTPIFSGAVPAGDHTLQVLIKLRGHGFGVFSYLRGIEANVRHDHTFSLTQGQDIEVIAVAWESGGPTTPAEKRPDVRFHDVLHKASDQKASAPARGRKKGKAAAASGGKD